MSMRADVALVKRGLCESRTRARAAIEGGTVFADGKLVKKPSEKISDDVELTAKALHPWVGRGGVKLAAALKSFAVNPNGLTCLDIGASTGGFTDVLLTGGARHVFAVDIGTAQLHDKIRGDSRVTVMEQTDARLLKPSDFNAPIDLIVCDASFISATKVLGMPMELASPKAQMVVLVKPQFEVGKGGLGKGGIVRDPEVARDALSIVASWVAAQGWRVIADCNSPIKGRSGNIEFLLHARKN
ncbi:MAG: TlyA family RNA methyltransferase [Robiginitomaculum sp.]